MLLPLEILVVCVWNVDYVRARGVRVIIILLSRVLSCLVNSVTFTPLPTIFKAGNFNMSAMFCESQSITINLKLNVEMNYFIGWLIFVLVPLKQQSLKKQS